MEESPNDQQLLTEIIRLRRSLRSIKIMLGFFFLMTLAMLAILGFIAYKVITFTRDINTKINNFESKTSQFEDKATQNLDFKNQVCSNKSLTTFLGSNNDICK